jgi:hypothetical protein
LSSAPARDEAEETFRWKALRILEVDTLVGVGGRSPRFYLEQPREGGVARGGATGSVRGHIVRLARRDKTPERKLTPPKKNRGGLTRRER